MKVFAISLPLLCVSAAAWRSEAPLGFGPAEDLTVPGENPLTYCPTAELDKFIGQIDYVNLDPNPPEQGKNLTVTAGGILTKDVDESSQAKVHVKVVWNKYVTLLKQDYDLCDVVDQVNLKCPLKNGVLNITKIVAIPAQVPPGTYVVSADVSMEDHKEVITCLEGSIKF